MKLKVSIILLFTLASTLTFQTASASQAIAQTHAANFPANTAIFVDISNTSGVEDGTAANPFTTIQEGINAAVSGDIVGVAPGTYYENVTIKTGVKLIGSGRSSTIIDGSGSGTVLKMEDASLIQEFTIQHGNTGFGAGIFAIGSPTISNNIIQSNNQSVSGAGAAIYGNCSSPIITGNLIQGNMMYSGNLSGAIAFEGCSSPYIANNVIAHNIGNGKGINLFVPSGNNPVVINNSIIYNSGVGININDFATTSTPNFLISNNILMGNSIGIQIEYGSTGYLPTITYNDVFENSINYFGLSNLTGVDGNISVNPFLSNIGHISSSSPLIDAGNPTVYPNFDYDGDYRPIDGNYDGIAISDIGADEKTQDDHIPPTISATAMKADNTPYTPDTWTNQNVTVKFTCSDAESGISACPSDQVFDAEGITAPIVGTAIDNAGNSASVSFGPIKIDKTPPVLLIAVSPNPVILNGDAKLLTSATDTLSGIMPGSMPCFSLDTTTVGFKFTHCFVSDNAGNQTKTTTIYQVIYGFDGFQKPIIDCTNNPCDNYNFSTFNTGSSIAIKFQLKDADGNSIQAGSDPLWLVPTKFDGNPPFSLPKDYQFQVSNIPYEWKKNQEAYMYDWNTKGLPDQTTWLVGVKLDDGSTHYVFIKLTK